jgi:hypothetical protein
MVQSAAASARVWMPRGTAGMTSVRSTEPRHSAQATAAANQSHPCESNLASALRAKQINVHVTVHWTSLQQARWASALSAPLYGAPLAGRVCGMGAAADAPEPSRAAAPSGLHSRASCQWWRNRATSSLPSALESGSNGGLVWPFGVSHAAMRSRKTRGQPTSLRRSCRRASRPCLASMVRQHSELGADGRCKAAWLPPSLAASEEAELRFGSTARSDRSMEPAARELELRPSQRIVQPLAETLRWFPRVFHCIGM